MIEVWAILEAPASAATNAQSADLAPDRRRVRFTVENLTAAPVAFAPGF